MLNSTGRLKAYPLSLSILVCCLILNGCGLMVATDINRVKATSQNQSVDGHGKSQEQLHIKLNLYLDLATRQNLVQEHWDRPILNHLEAQRYTLNKPSTKTTNEQSFMLSSTLLTNGFLLHLEHELNQEFKALGIKVSLNSLQAWESSLDGKALSLDHLAHTLRSKPTPTFNVSQDASTPMVQEMHIGLTSSPLPSFAQLSDLLWARAGVSAVIVNRPLSYYKTNGETRESKTAIETAIIRLLLRGIAESLYLAPVCDGGWGGANRDQLLGLKTLALVTPNHQNVSPSLRRDPYLRGAPPPSNEEYNEASSPRPWSFKALSWSQSSKELFKLHVGQSLKQSTVLSTHCKRFDLLSLSCKPNPDSKSPVANHLSNIINPLFKHAGEVCMSQENSLIAQYNKGHLNSAYWQDYRQSAIGLLSLKKQKFKKAYSLCQKVAKHHPQLVASKCAGLAALELGDFSLASLYLRAYLSSHPDEIDSLSALAKSLGHEGKDKEALAILQRLSKRPKKELGEKANQVWFNLGIAHARLGFVSKAKQAWLELELNSSEAQEAKKLLERLDAQSP